MSEMLYNPYDLIIIQENVIPQKNIDEIIYTFSQYKNNRLDSIFMKKSKYILQTDKGQLKEKNTSFIHIALDPPLPIIHNLK